MSVFKDTFTDTEGVALEAHTPDQGVGWTKVRDGEVYADISIGAMGIVTQAGTGPTVYAPDDPGNADHYVQFRVKNYLFNNNNFIAVRLVDENNFIGFREWSGTKALTKVVGGVETDLITASGVVDEFIKIETEGNVIRMYEGGTGATPNWIQVGGDQTVTDHAAETSVGLVLSRARSDPFYDDWESGPLSTSTPINVDFNTESAPVSGNSFQIFAVENLSFVAGSASAIGSLFRINPESLFVWGPLRFAQDSIVQAADSVSFSVGAAQSAGNSFGVYSDQNVEFAAISAQFSGAAFSVFEDQDSDFAVGDSASAGQAFDIGVGGDVAFSVASGLIAGNVFEIDAQVNVLFALTPALVAGQPFAIELASNVNFAITNKSVAGLVFTTGADEVVSFVRGSAAITSLEFGTRLDANIPFSAGAGNITGAAYTVTSDVNVEFEAAPAEVAGQSFGVFQGGGVAFGIGNGAIIAYAMSITADANIGFGVGATPVSGLAFNALLDEAIGFDISDALISTYGFFTVALPMIDGNPFATIDVDYGSKTMYFNGQNYFTITEAGSA